MISWQKDIWISTRKKIEDNDGEDLAFYNEPKHYKINYQPMSSYLDYQKYGENIKDMYTAYVNRAQYQNKFKAGDRVYLIDGDKSYEEVKLLTETDNEYCLKANYKIVSVLPQNVMIKLDFEKI